MSKARQAQPKQTLLYLLAYLAAGALVPVLALGFMFLTFHIVRALIYGGQPSLSVLISFPTLELLALGFAFIVPALAIKQLAIPRAPGSIVVAEAVAVFSYQLLIQYGISGLSWMPALYIAPLTAIVCAACALLEKYQPPKFVAYILFAVVLVALQLSLTPAMAIAKSLGARHAAVVNEQKVQQVAAVTANRLGHMKFPLLMPNVPSYKLVWQQASSGGTDASFVYQSMSNKNTEILIYEYTAPSTFSPPTDCSGPSYADTFEPGAKHYTCAAMGQTTGGSTIYEIKAYPGYLMTTQGTTVITASSTSDLNIHGVYTPNVTLAVISAF